jgi:thiamine transporter ThiT
MNSLTFYAELVRTCFCRCSAVFFSILEIMDWAFIWLITSIQKVPKFLILQILNVGWIMTIIERGLKNGILQLQYGDHYQVLSDQESTNYHSLY